MQFGRYRLVTDGTERTRVTKRNDVNVLPRSPGVTDIFRPSSELHLKVPVIERSVSFVFFFLIFDRTFLSRRVLAVTCFYVVCKSESAFTYGLKH